MCTSGSMMPNAGRKATLERNGDAGDPVAFVWLTIQEDLPSDTSSSSYVASLSSDKSSANHAGGESPTRGFRHVLVVTASPGQAREECERECRRQLRLLDRTWRPEETRVVGTEEELLCTVASLIREVDADILISWDARRESVGFLIDRANVLGIEPPLIRQMGRTPTRRSLKNSQ